jgi:hypothetical protein
VKGRIPPGLSLLVPFPAILPETLDATLATCLVDPDPVQKPPDSVDSILDIVLRDDLDIA